MSRPEEFLTNGGRAGSVPGYSFPSSVASLSDPRLTDWLKHTVHPFGGVAEGVTLHNLLPTGFADYARILHPARRVGTHEPVSWSEVADRLGRTMHPLVQWGRLVGTDDPYGHPDWAYSPEPGRLPEEVATHLIEVLQEHTKTPNNCLLGIWEGYGSFAEQFPQVPRLVLPDRTYLMFAGPVEVVVELAGESGSLTPNLWWPEDRSWCVATEIDFVETYVGGNLSCVEEILACPDLETFRVTGNARIDFFTDTTNI